jgi:O-antigen/teichoic acid export membrane protein
MRFRITAPRRDILVPLVTSTIPIWISQVFYLIVSVVDVLLLERFHGNAAVGVYSLCKTLGSVFVFTSTAISSTLMPKIAALPDKRDHVPLLRKALLANTGISLILLAIFAVSYNWAMATVFSQRYVVGPEVFLTVAISSIIACTNAIISAVMVGSDRARIETISLISGVAVSVVVGLLMIPGYGVPGAAITLVSGGLTALAVLVFVGLRHYRNAPVAAS